MAATIATASTVIGLATSSLSSPARVSSPTKTTTSLTSGFLKSPVMPRNALRQQVRGASGGKFTCFERDWLRTDLNVIGFGLIGWLAPSSIPAINGKSLTGLFFESIGSELAHFPTGPALTSPFWVQKIQIRGEGYMARADGRPQLWAGMWVYLFILGKMVVEFHRQRDEIPRNAKQRAVSGAQPRGLKNFQLGKEGFVD